MSKESLEHSVGSSRASQLAQRRDAGILIDWLSLPHVDQLEQLRELARKTPITVVRVKTVPDTRVAANATARNILTR